MIKYKSLYIVIKLIPYITTQIKEKKLNRDIKIRFISLYRLIQFLHKIGKPIFNLFLNHLFLSSYLLNHLFELCSVDTDLFERNELCSVDTIYIEFFSIELSILIFILTFLLSCIVSRWYRCIWRKWITS
jgi:hypothetical protein